jgi:hypothetical protein
VQKVQGDLLLITEWKCDYSSLWRSTMWGKIDEGWVSLDYVTFDGVLPPDQTVQSIQIAQNPNKLSYLHTLEELDVTGGKLLLTYADGSTATVDITADMVDGFNNANIGTNTVTVSYSGLTTTFDVQIVKAKVIFQLEDGTILSEKEYAVGETVEIPADPTKSADETYTYVFTGWDKEVVPCAGNTVYTAQFESVYIDYTVKFLDADGTVISTGTYHYGDTVVVPADPEAPEGYFFKGWTPEITVCQGDEVYTAVFEKIFDCGDANGDGTVNPLDALILLQCYIGMVDVETLNFAACDCNGDGTINPLDALLVLQYYIGIIDKFPVE